MSIDVLSYLQENWIELVAMVLSILGVLLTAREKTINWPVNIAACIMYGYIFLTAKIYGDACLQVFFIVFSFYGWYEWTKVSDKKKEVFISKTPKRSLLIILFITIPGTLIAGFVLKKYTDSTIPFLDGFTTILSLIATWMATHKHIENWLIWILADIIYIAEYIIKNLYPTALLYFIFTLMAVYGYFEWKKLQKKLSA